MDETAPRLKIASRSGSIRVRAIAGATLHAEGARFVTSSDGWTTVDPGSNSASIELVCPEHSDLNLGAMSGKVELRGALGHVRVVTASGSVRIDTAASVDVRSTSSSVRITACHGQCRVVTVNGKVNVDSAPHVDIHTTSGSVTVLDTVAGHVRTVSGSVEIGLSASPDLDIRTVSSGVEVVMPKALRPLTRLHSISGRVRTDSPEDGVDGRVAVTTVSGSIQVKAQ